jgi:hypothetical protein
MNLAVDAGVGDMSFVDRKTLDLFRFADCRLSVARIEAWVAEVQHIRSGNFHVLGHVDFAIL